MLSINGDKICWIGPPGSQEVPQQYMKTLKDALRLIESRIVGKYHCDEIFAALPNGKTFSQIFNDGSYYVNYDPRNEQDDWGWTQPSTNPKDIVVTQFTLRMGRWNTAGTIVHELAHLNGAPGGASAAAESTLRSCGLRSPNGPYDPSVLG